MSAPRVLLVGSVLGQPMGGVRRHHAELLPRVARLLEEDGGSLSILEGTGGIAFELPESVERIRTEIPAGPPLTRVKGETKQLRALLARRQEGERAFDLVHTGHHPIPGRLPLPLSLTIHDLRYLQRGHGSWLHRWIAKRVLAEAFDRVARVIVVSEAVSEEIAQRFELHRDRISVVPNAGDHFDPLPRTPDPEAPLLCVGHLEPRKNVDVLLQALALDATLPDLWLAGGAKGGEAERLRGRARELGIEDRLRFLGAFEDEDLPRLYAEAACVVLPSRIEGFGIAVLEAHRALTPLALSDIPAHAEVAHADTPRFPPRDAAACVRAIRAALEADSERLEAARSSAARFHWDESAAALCEAWRRAAGR